MIRPTICASAITSYWVGLPVGCRNRSVVAATNPLPHRAGLLALAGSRVTGGHLKLDGSPRCRRPPQPAQQRRWRGTIPWQLTDATCMIAPAGVDHNRMFCADRSFCWQCVQPRWSELGSQIAHTLGVELGTLPDHRGDIGLIGLRPGGRGARTPPAGDGARKI